MEGEEIDKGYMRDALKVAEAALLMGEVPVGCVIVLSQHPSLPKGESVVISHGSNQVNATRDATRHAEMVAIDRLLTLGVSSDKLRLPPDVGETKHQGIDTPDGFQMHKEARLKYWDDRWINVEDEPNHWKNSYGWGNKNNISELRSANIFQYCDLYVTCEPCIMCAAALASVGIRRVIFGCQNDRFGGCGSLLHLHVAEKGCREQETLSRGYELTTGVLEEEAITLLRSFYKRENLFAPIEKRKLK